MLPRAWRTAKPGGRAAVLERVESFGVGSRMGHGGNNVICPHRQQGTGIGTAALFDHVFYVSEEMRAMRQRISDRGRHSDDGRAVRT